MSWTLSRYRTGDLVEIRSKDEILATLDDRGCADGMPFMPEMLQFCGRRVRVAAVAHKTCDTAGQTAKSRRLNATVHLAGLRCDGSAHDGCQAECNLFWKDVWIKPVAENGKTDRATEPKAVPASERDAAWLMARTRVTGASTSEEAPYFCQATQMFIATTPLAWWDPRQYILDVWTGNRSLTVVSRVLFLATLRWILARLPLGYRVFKSFHDSMHMRLTGRGSPRLDAKI